MLGSINPARAAVRLEYDDIVFDEEDTRCRPCGAFCDLALMAAMNIATKLDGAAVSRNA